MNDFRRFKQALKHANPYRTKSNQFAPDDNYHHLIGEIPDKTENQPQPKKSKTDESKKDEIKVKEKAQAGQQIASKLLNKNASNPKNQMLVSEMQKIMDEYPYDETDIRTWLDGQVINEYRLKEDKNLTDAKRETILANFKKEKKERAELDKKDPAGAEYAKLTTFRSKEEEEAAYKKMNNKNLKRVRELREHNIKVNKYDSLHEKMKKKEKLTPEESDFVLQARTDFMSNSLSLDPKYKNKEKRDEFIKTLELEKLSPDDFLTLLSKTNDIGTSKQTRRQVLLGIGIAAAAFIALKHTIQIVAVIAEATKRNRWFSYLKGLS